MRIQLGLAAAVLLCANSFSVADVRPVDPFHGHRQETFENNLPPGTYDMVPLFGGMAVLDDTLSDVAVISEKWSGPGGTLLPYEGDMFAGTPTGSQVFDFLGGLVTRFGGYMSTVSDVADGTVAFYDWKGDLFDEVPVTITPGEWGWQGWRGGPISRIEFTGNGPVGERPIQFDDLRVCFWPEPGTASLVALGAILLLRRRH